MPIQANFNKLVYLKKFNNYFNRKIYGGNALEDYYNPSADGGEVVEESQTFTQDNILNFVSGESFDIKGKLEDLPFGIDIGFNFDLEYDATGTITFIDYEYIKEKKIIIFHFFSTVAAIEDIISLTFKIDYQYNNRDYFIVSDINFNKNDGVVSEIVGNNVPFDPDYLLVLDNETDEIVSRWFVIRQVRVRNRQYQYALKRDVIYDKLEQLLEAPMYVQKGMLQDSDSFVVNNEGMMVNQIKTKETRLLDKTNMAWAVLYINRTTPETTAVGDIYAINMKISGPTVRQHTFDVPYDVIAIPFFVEANGIWHTATVIDTDSTTFTSDSVYIADVLEVMARQLDANLYDIQYLPYCPLADQLVGSGTQMDLGRLPKGGLEGEEFDYIKFGATKVGMLLYIDYPSFIATLHEEDNQKIETNLTIKESSNLQLYRIVSPNYQGSFDVNIGKNNNKLDNFQAECTYKPYTPFIKVKPYFYPSGFYGVNQYDARGLICGGDFSIARTTDAWISFQLQNKNYQNIFNREVQNLEFNQSLEMRNQIISAAVGHFTGAIAGAAGGAAMGAVAGPYGAAAGAIVGAVVGGVSSLVSGIIDTITLYQQQREQKSLMLDKYNYQLGNIQALPYTLTKVSSIDFISKIFPFVEEYNCKDEELEAFRNKIKYESMTVLRIDKLYNFYNKFDELCYFKAELIRNDEIAETAYFFDALYAELMKGVYI